MTGSPRPSAATSCPAPTATLHPLAEPGPQPEPDPQPLQAEVDPNQLTLDLDVLVVPPPPPPPPKPLPGGSPITCGDCLASLLLPDAERHHTRTMTTDAPKTETAGHPATTFRETERPISPFRPGRICKESGCTRAATAHLSWRRWYGEQDLCASHALWDLANSIRELPARPVARLADVEWSNEGGERYDQPLALRSVRLSFAGGETAWCGVDGCDWFGPLTDLWIDGGYLVCRRCHEGPHDKWGRPIVEPAQVRWPDRPWVWLPHDDPWWADPPREWITTRELGLGWGWPQTGNVRAKVRTAGLPPYGSGRGITVPGAPVRTDDLWAFGPLGHQRPDAILPVGTRLELLERRSDWWSDYHYTGDIPEDTIRLQMPDGAELFLWVLHGGAGDPITASVVPVSWGESGAMPRRRAGRRRRRPGSSPSSWCNRGVVLAPAPQLASSSPELTSWWSK